MYEMFVECSGDDGTCAFDVNNFDMSLFDLLVEGRSQRSHIKATFPSM